jgi:hypothetical protein
MAASLLLEPAVSAGQAPAVAPEARAELVSAGMAEAEMAAAATAASVGAAGTAETAEAAVLVVTLTQAAVQRSGSAAPGPV